MKTLARRPSARFVWLIASLFLAALGLETATLLIGDATTLPIPLLRRALLGALALLSITALFDLYALRELPLPEVRRTLPRNLALRDAAQVGLRVRGLAELRSDVELVDDPPRHAECEGLPIRFDRDQLAAGAGPAGEAAQEPEAAGEYVVRPMRRGDAAFHRPTLRAHSPFGLFHYTARCGEAETVRVYPNFQALSRFGALMLDQHTAQVGIKQIQRRGEGLEFHQLREYRQGDALRQVDWKATSRKQSLISREYEDERDQRVVFLLDSSRRMRAKDGPLSHYDHSLNAMILLSYVALRAGDSVGMLAFGGEPRFLPVGKGRSNVSRILNAVYDLEPSTRAGDFSGAAEQLTARQPRRSLVILLTNLRMEDVDDLLPAVALLRHRHLVLVVNLRESELDAVAGRDVKDLSDALRALGTFDHLRERAEVQERIAAAGALTLDTTPGELHVQLINSYRAIKRSGEL